MAAACDPAGVITDSASTVPGCYIESVNFQTPCPYHDGACTGFCHGAADGGDNYPLVCVLDPHTSCDGG